MYEINLGKPSAFAYREPRLPFDLSLNLTLSLHFQRIFQRVFALRCRLSELKRDLWNSHAQITFKFIHQIILLGVKSSSSRFCTMYNYLDTLHAPTGKIQYIVHASSLTSHLIETEPNTKHNARTYTSKNIWMDGYEGGGGRRGNRGDGSRLRPFKIIFYQDYCRWKW